VAGLSFGLSAFSGAIELEVDPARFQFSENEFIFDFHSTLNIPAKKPLFSGEADLIFKHSDSENSASGSLSADIKIPPGNGFIVNSTNNVNFLFTKDQTSVYTTSSPGDCDNMTTTLSETPGLNAKILKIIDLEGDIVYQYNKETEISCGKIIGVASLGFYEDFDKKFGPLKMTGYFNVDFTATAGLAFQNSTISYATINGSIDLGTQVNVWLGSTHYMGEANFKGAAGIYYKNEIATFKAGYSTDIIVEKDDGAGNKTKKSYHVSNTIEKDLSELILSE
jgi:hypothetical protein